MNYPKVLVTAGFVIFGIGILVMLAGQRVSGGWVATVGFYVVVAGITLSVFSEDFQNKAGKLGVAMKIGVIGFAISSLSFVIALLEVSRMFENLVFYGGVVLVVVGWLLFVLRMKLK